MSLETLTGIGFKGMAHQGFGIELEGFYRGHGVSRCTFEVGMHPKTVNKLTPKWFGPEWLTDSPRVLGQTGT